MAIDHLEHLHFHVCENCYHIWLHERRQDKTVVESRVYHRCPKCMSGPYRSAYNTRREADEVKRILRGADEMLAPPLSSDAIQQAAKSGKTA